MTEWLQILARVLDGEDVSSEEAQTLLTALSEKENLESAREWMEFEFTLAGQSQQQPEYSRERLLARMLLREKHSSIMADQRTNAVPQDADPTVANVGRQSSRMRNQWLRPATAIAILLVVLVIFWRDSSGHSYAGPTVYGDYRVLGAMNPGDHEPVERGDRLVSGGRGAQMELGSYCLLELGAHTDVTIRGKPHYENVELHQGHLKARIAPHHGRFHVRTPLGSIAVKGTEFETTVEYQGGPPGELNSSDAKKVVVRVSVLSGAVLCELSDKPVVVNAGSQRVFTSEIESQKTSGDVVSTTASTVTLRVDDSSTKTFHTGGNRFAIHEAAELLEGDRVTIIWTEEGGRRQIQGIDGEGIHSGTIVALGDTWIELQTAEHTVRLRAPWRGGNPWDGGGPDRVVVEKLSHCQVGDEVDVNWSIPEGKRVMDLRVRKTTEIGRQE